MKFVVGILAVSLVLNAYLGMKNLKHMSDIESVVFSHANYENALELAALLISKSEMSREVMSRTMAEFYRDNRTEVATDSFFETPIAFEFDTNDRVISAKVALK